MSPKYGRRNATTGGAVDRRGGASTTHLVIGSRDSLVDRQMLDYVSLGADLTEEEQMVRETARRFVEREVDPEIGDHWFDGTFPTDLIEEMGELGFYTPNLDGFGLPSLSETAYGVLMQELEACDSGIRSMASVQGALVIVPHTRVRERRAKGRVASRPRGRDGRRVLRADRTQPRLEPLGDGDPRRSRRRRLRAKRHEDVDHELPHRGRRGRLGARPQRPRDARPGVPRRDGPRRRRPKIEEKLSLRASITGQVELSNVHVPEENVLPGVEGMKGPLSCLTQARYGIAWGAVGAARDSFETALEYATDREQFGKPIGGFQLQQRKLAEMATQITTAQLLAHRLAELKERGDLRPEQVSMAKRNNVRMARDQSRVAREMLGGNGITMDYSPMRQMCNMETVYTYEGTHDIHTLILGHDLTWIPAFE